MRLMKRLSFWVRSISWVREKLPWGSHRPVLHSAPVMHAASIVASQDLEVCFYTGETSLDRLLTAATHVM